MYRPAWSNKNRWKVDTPTATTTCYFILPRTLMKEEKQKAFVLSSECENGSHEALFYPDKCPPNCHPEFTFPCPLFFVSFEDETRMENSLIILFAMFWPLQSSTVYLIQTVFLKTLKTSMQFWLIQVFKAYRIKL